MFLTPLADTCLLLAPCAHQDFIRKVCKPMYTEIVRDDRSGGVMGVVEFESKVGGRSSSALAKCSPLLLSGPPSAALPCA